MTTTGPIEVNARRLWESIEQINRFGATKQGGVRRLEFSQENKCARDQLVQWCQEAGCRVRIDQFGNLFARRPSRDPKAPAVLAGSHLDTQTSGGRFDGVFGVMACLETLRTLNEKQIETQAPIELAVWTNEEGELFRPMLGSAVWCGDIELKAALDLLEADGLSVREGLSRMGYLGDMPINSYAVKCYFEAHIEQGPILFDEGKVIGVVTGAQKQIWYDLRVIGKEAHAGPTPMLSRRDAFVACAQMVLEIDRIGREFKNARATCGSASIYPNSRNTVAGEVKFTADLRNPDPSVLAAMDRAMRGRCQEVASRAKVQLEIGVHTVIEDVPFHPTLVSWVREAAQAGGLAWREMYTGAGHDAVNIAKRYPTTMVFVPCKEGISHNPSEDALPEDLAAGAAVLAAVMLRAANDTELL